jgi:hypothetical protein
VSATLRSKVGPWRGTETLVLDCPHGTTRGVLVNAGDPRQRQAAVDAIVQRHVLEEGCECVAALRPTLQEVQA